MNETPSSPRCPDCGAPIPAHLPEGVCPRCVLARVAAPTEPAPLPGGSRPPPPSREAVAAAFPQLEILELIGQGGMGCVFRARQPRLNRVVALKVLPEALARDATFAARFAREARLLAAMNHPNIVTIHDSGQAGAFFYLLMEHVDGVNLRQALRAGRFSPEQALAIVPPLCDALQYAHERGVVHRDIKPENILLDREGRVKIADFGIARMLGAETAQTPESGRPGPGDAGTAAAGQPESAAPLLPDVSAAAGTPGYMAPEQIDSPHTADRRTDIYSLGVVLYEMLTGRLPTQPIEPPSRRIHVDVRLDEIVLRALDREPERRYQTAMEVRTAVEHVRSTPAAAGAPPGPPPSAGIGDAVPPGGPTGFDRFAPAHGLALCGFWLGVGLARELAVVTTVSLGGIACFALLSWLARGSPRASGRNAPGETPAAGLARFLPGPGEAPGLHALIRIMLLAWMVAGIRYDKILLSVIGGLGWAAYVAASLVQRWWSGTAEVSPPPASRFVRVTWRDGQPRPCWPGIAMAAALDALLAAGTAALVHILWTTGRVGAEDLLSSVLTGTAVGLGISAGLSLNALRTPPLDNGPDGRRPAASSPPSPPPPPVEAEATSGRDPRRQRRLWYGFITCLVGLPVGLAMELPLVWGLSLAGILVSAFRPGGVVADLLAAARRRRTADAPEAGAHRQAVAVVAGIVLLVALLPALVTALTLGVLRLVSSSGRGDPGGGASADQARAPEFAWPGGETSGAAGFGPVRAVTLRRAGDLQDAFLDLESGEVRSAPPDLVQALRSAGHLTDSGHVSIPPILGWMRTNGLELVCRDGPSGLTLVDGAAVLVSESSPADGAFDGRAARSLAPLAGTLEEMLAQHVALGGGSPALFWFEPHDPGCTWYFQTRAGTKGVIEVRPRSMRADAIGFRYKLVAASGENP